MLFGSEPDRAQLNLLAKNVTKLEELNFDFEAKIQSMGDENKDQITGDKINSLAFKALNDPKNTYDPSKDLLI